MSRTRFLVASFIISCCSVVQAHAEEPRSQQVPPTWAEMGLMQGFPPPADKLVTRKNWQNPPFNRWAFQHLEQILRTAQISRGSGPVAELPMEFKDLSRVTFETEKGENSTVQQMLDATYTDGFVVLKNGKIAYEVYFNGMSRDKRHIIQSTSKSLTGSAATILIHEGRLEPKALVTKYIPELEGSAFEGATVRQVLDMSNSVVWREEYTNPNSEIKRFEQANLWEDYTEIAKKGTYDFLKTLKKDKHDHGVKFHYATGNTDIVSWLIERASGQRFTDFFTQRVWSRLGAEHDASLSVDINGFGAGSGGFAMTTRDFARFGEMMRNNGQLAGRQVLPSGQVMDTILNGNNDQYKQSNYAKIFNSPNGFYRNQWWMTGNDHGTYFAIGVYGQLLWVNPAAEVVVAKLSSWPDAVDVERGRNTFRMLEAIAAALK
jgi:CubicO group peptidase (beta-lactamase class C family)